jgi:hypothetical protein
MKGRYRAFVDATGPYPSPLRRGPPGPAAKLPSEAKANGLVSTHVARRGEEQVRAMAAAWHGPDDRVPPKRVQFGFSRFEKGALKYGHRWWDL